MTGAEMREQIALCEAKEIAGQFTVEPWAGGWMATAYQGGPGSSVCLFGTDRESCLAKVQDMYSRGKVPMNAMPSSEYHAEALRHKLTARVQS
jgi:hypothetical protein